MHLRNKASKLFLTHGITRTFSELDKMALWFLWEKISNQVRQNHCNSCNRELLCVPNNITPGTYGMWYARLFTRKIGYVIDTTVQ